MNYLQKYAIKRDFELGIIKEEDMPEDILREIKELYIKEANNYYNEYVLLKKKYNMLKNQVKSAK